MSSTPYAQLGRPSVGLDLSTTQNIDFLLKAQLPAVFAKVLKKEITSDTNLIIEKRHFEALRQQLWLMCLSLNASVPISEKHFHAWMSVCFDNLRLARKTVLNMTVEKDTKRHRNLEELKQSIGRCFHRDLWIDWNSGTRDCGLLKASCKNMLEVCSVFPLLEKFRSDASHEQITRVIRYFGAQYLPGLNMANYWDNWTSIQQLLEYIEEAPGALYSMDAHEQTLALCPTQAEVFAFDAILDCLSPTQRKDWGYINVKTHPNIPKDKNLSILLKQVADLNGSTNDNTARAVQICFGQTDMSYDPSEGADNSEFYTWVEQLHSLRNCQWFLDSKDNYWTRFNGQMARNFRNVVVMDAYLYGKPVIDKHSALAFLQAAYKWRKQQQPTRPAPSSTGPRLTTLELVALLEKTVDEMDAKECTKQGVIKTVLINELAKQGFCTVCGYLGHFHPNPRSKYYIHSEADCPVRLKMAVEDNGTISGDNFRTGNGLFYFLRHFGAMSSTKRSLEDSKVPETQKKPRKR